MSAVDTPVTKSDLDAAIERLEGKFTSEIRRLEGKFTSEMELLEGRMIRRIDAVELRIVKQINRYLGGLSIALISGVAAAAIAVILGG